MNGNVDELLVAMAVASSVAVNAIPKRSVESQYGSRERRNGRDKVLATDRWRKREWSGDANNSAKNDRVDRDGHAVFQSSNEIVERSI
jgi:hypothetical protein